MTGKVCVHQQYWAGDASAYRFVPVSKFAAAFTRSKAGASQAAMLAEPFQVSQDADKALAWTKHALTGLHLPVLLPGDRGFRIFTFIHCMCSPGTV